MSYEITGAELLESGKRFAVTMFEYSWLVQRSGRQAEYRDWDKVLDEVVERGYDCIRIDAFPHVLHKEQVTFLPIEKEFMWGNHENVTVNPKQGLIEFMRKAKDRGLYIGLSSWLNDDTEHHKLDIKTPDDFTNMWIQVLDTLAEEDLLDGVVWVDLCNEFPLKHWCPKVFEYITGEPASEPMGQQTFHNLGREWTADEIARLSEYFVNAIKPVKAKYPQLKYTFSNQCFGELNFMQGDTSEFDLVEPHIWATDNMEWAAMTGYFEALAGPFPETIAALYRKSEQLFNQDKKRVYDILDQRTELWANFAKEKGIKLVTTEAWTSVVYEDLSHCGFLGEWDWFKEVAEIGVRLAVEKGWTGVCTSNFCEPHFEGMWYDVEWHKRMTGFIRNGE